MLHPDELPRAEKIRVTARNHYRATNISVPKVAVRKPESHDWAGWRNHWN
jgi:hypothetical protein